MTNVLAVVKPILARPAYLSNFDLSGFFACSKLRFSITPALAGMPAKLAIRPY